MIKSKFFIILLFAAFMGNVFSQEQVRDERYLQKLCNEFVNKLESEIQEHNKSVEFEPIFLNDGQRDSNILVAAVFSADLYADPKHQHIIIEDQILLFKFFNTKNPFTIENQSLRIQDISKGEIHNIIIEDQVLLLVVPSDSAPGLIPAFQDTSFWVSQHPLQVEKTSALCIVNQRT